MYKLGSSTPSTRNNEEVDTNVAASARTRSLGGADPMTDCVKPPFVDGGVTGLKLTEAPQQGRRFRFSLGGGARH